MLMKKASWILILAILALAGGAGAGLLGGRTALAAPPPQLTSFTTPTAGSDGRIVYIVQEGDTLWRIAAVAGIDVAELRDLNNLDPDDIVFPGMSLFLGLGGPAAQVSTAAPQATEAPAQPSETPVPGLGVLCALLFDDVNGDSMRQEEEVSLAGGAINISNREGTVSITQDTPGHDPNSPTLDYFCTENLLEGDYNVSVAIPEGYNPTTSLNTAVELAAGDTTYLTFGAQAGSVVIDASTSLPEKAGSTPLLGVIGGLLLLGGIGLGVYSVWFRRR